MSSGQTLVTFDVDGTLLHAVPGQGSKPANKLHRQCFAHAMQSVFGVEGDIDVIQHHGGTDPLILLACCMHYGIDKDSALSKLPDMCDAMCSYFAEHRDGDLGIEILPGVQPLLAQLATRDDVVICLVTGNLEPLGWGKMEALGLKQYFTPPCCGGFGSDFCSGTVDEMWRDRAELIAVAAGKVAAAHPSRSIARRVHVGDTPMDVRAAAAAGALPLGVLTGTFDEEQLRACVPESFPILPDLTDTAAVLRAMQLDPA